jgi:VWFA-related protein
MPSPMLFFRRSSCLALLCLCALLSTAQGQQATRPAQREQDEDVVRINTELVQTDVMVFDKSGRFVDGLKPEQFELRVDGKAQAVSFFERIAAGSANEEAQLAASRGINRPSSASEQSKPLPLDRGRTVFFFIDDLHISPGDVPRVRSLLSHFVDKEMGQNDQAAITSATGQIGFLQQLTNDKLVLQAAIKRLMPRSRSSIDSARPPMTEYQALAIERYDKDVTDFFVDQVLKDMPGTRPEVARNIVAARASNILQQAANITISSLSTFESLLRSSASLPGRKLVFFVSGGFFLDTNNSNAADRMRRITDAAKRTGTVIYSIDARGLSTVGLPDASSDMPADPGHRLIRTNLDELSASQDTLHALAADTGGRALLNSNALETMVTRALKETSIYYLLAWRPDNEAQRDRKFQHLEVRVTGHPEFTVRTRRGLYATETKIPAPRSNSEKRPVSTKTPDDELRETIKALYPTDALPTQLNLAYFDMPDKGLVLAASMQIVTQFVGFEQAGDKQMAAVDIVGVVLNDQGKPAASFRDHLNISANAPSSSASSHPNILYNYQTHLAPGLYQVRVAARDSKSGRTGSAMQWIEIPDITSHRLSLSSLLLGEVPKRSEKGNPAAIATLSMSIDHRFAPTSKLRFLTFIYNAAHGTGDADPDLALQMQILRDDQPVVTIPLRKVATEGAQDPARLSYAAEIPLDGMLPGRYVLQVTIIDRIAKTSATQHTNFEIE